MNRPAEPGDFIATRRRARVAGALDLLMIAGVAHLASAFAARDARGSLPASITPASSLSPRAAAPASTTAARGTSTARAAGRAR